MQKRKIKKGKNLRSKSAKRLTKVVKDCLNEEYKVYKTPNLMAATYYNDSSVRIPLFYSRPGPATY